MPKIPPTLFTAPITPQEEDDWVQWLGARGCRPHRWIPDFFGYQVWCRATVPEFLLIQFMSKFPEITVVQPLPEGIVIRRTSDLDYLHRTIAKKHPGATNKQGALGPTYSGTLIQEALHKGLRKRGSQ